MKRLLPVLVLLACLGTAHAQTFVLAANANCTTATACTVTITGNAGDTILLAGGEPANNTSTLSGSDSTGGTNTWSTIGQAGCATCGRTGWAVSTLTAGVTTVTATWSGSLSTTVNAIALRFTGATSTTDGTAIGSSTTSSVTTLASGALTTTNAADILVLVTATGGTGGTYSTPTSGYTLDTNAHTTQMAAIYKISVATQSGGTASISWTTARSNDDGFYAAVQAAAAGATPGFDKAHRLELLDARLIP